MLSHLKILLEGIVKDPGERISRLQMLTEGEWKQLKQWNDTLREYPRERCLAELFEEQARGRSQAVAVVSESGE